VLNLKGGVGKTTSAVNIATLIAARGESVLLVDADPQGSALQWSETVDLSFPVVSLPVKDLHRRVPQLLKNVLGKIAAWRRASCDWWGECEACDLLPRLATRRT
jgi:cellulose biosynthesis protein BcsQ